MATSVDICNLALNLLGESDEVLSINPPDGGELAGTCARWYPHAVKSVFEEFDWHFATKREELAKYSQLDETLYQWKYSFALPAQCIRVINAGMREDRHLLPIEFEVELGQQETGRALYCNVEHPVLTYVAANQNATTYPAYFVDCVVTKLAAMLVGPLRRSDSASTAAQNLLRQYSQALAQAKTLDSKMSISHRLSRRTPDNIKARFV